MQEAKWWEKLYMAQGEGQQGPGAAHKPPHLTSFIVGWHRQPALLVQSPNVPQTEIEGVDFTVLVNVGVLNLATTRWMNMNMTFKHKNR